MYFQSELSSENQVMLEMFVLIDFDLVSNFVGSHSSHGGDDDEECGGLLMSVSGQ